MLRPAAITFVRLGESEAREALGAYVQGVGAISDRIRVPRGCDPELVTKYLIDEVAPDAEHNVFERALAVGRFYESREAAASFARVLDGQVSDSGEIARACFASQFLGDLGEPAMADAAATYFDAQLVPHPEAKLVFPLLFETRLVLSPHGATDALAARVKREVDSAEPHQEESEQAMNAYDKMLSVQENEQPKTIGLEGIKADIDAMDPDAKRKKMSRLYTLRPGEPAHPYLQIWSARKLREEAMAEDGQAPVLDEVRACLAEAAPPTPEEKGDTKTIHRAAQALVYLGDDLTPDEEAWYHGAEETMMNFLWDDNPGMIPPPPEKPQT